MNTKVIASSGRSGGFSRPRIRAASRMVSPIRRFKNMIELSDWEDRILQKEPGNPTPSAGCSPGEQRHFFANRLPRHERLADCQKTPSAAFPSSLVPEAYA